MWVRQLILQFSNCEKVILVLLITMKMLDLALKDYFRLKHFLLERECRGHKIIALKGRTDYPV